MFWFAVYWPTYHFTMTQFFSFFKKNLLLLFINSLALKQGLFFLDKDKKKKKILPTNPAWKFWVGKQQTNISFKVGLTA